MPDKKRREKTKSFRLCNGRVTVTNDCHDAKFIAYGLNSGEQYLKSLGFKSVTVMKNGKFVEQSI